jgi:aminoglycoside/choline kinase family phosphotransferase
MTLTAPPASIFDRAAQRSLFLAAAGLAGVPLDALPVDASFRRYFRLAGSDPAMLLMDAPPPKEDIRPFLRVGRHLAELGLRPPRIFEADEAAGFALIEDFGEGTYTRLLDGGADPATLFRPAAEALALLHTHPNGAAIAAPVFDRAKMLDEVSELPDWYGLAVQGTPVSVDARTGFLTAWADLFARLPPPETGLVLLDFHVDNLMRVPGGIGAGACGLLDFQDARIGPRAYDLMTLLRNERRGIDPTVSEALYLHYLEVARPADPEGFGLWYRVLAAQRYAKVLGRFARLTLRDGRDGYLRYLPRVARLMEEALAAEPMLADIGDRLDAMLPGWRMPPPDDPAALRRRVASESRGA